MSHGGHGIDGSCGDRSKSSETPELTQHQSAFRQPACENGRDRAACGGQRRLGLAANAPPPSGLRFGGTPHLRRYQVETVQCGRISWTCSTPFCTRQDRCGREWAPLCARGQDRGIWSDVEVVTGGAADRNADAHLRQATALPFIQKHSRATILRFRADGDRSPHRALRKAIHCAAAG